MTFKDLGIIDPILQALEEKGYKTPTPIQEKSVPILLKGKDLLGCAQTGTGKTASFAIPIIQMLAKEHNENNRQRKIKALVVTPTRELAIQIEENFTEYSRYTKLRNTVIFGGVKQGAQTARLRQGIDVLIATPGRLLDLISQKFITLRDIEYFVLDEADQMLDMGFIHDIKKIIKMLPRERQSLFFSATMPKASAELSTQILGDYERVDIQPEQATAEKVEQGIYFVSKGDKSKLLVHLLKTENKGATLVFSRTKHGADKIVKILKKSEITAAAIHGNKSQVQRQKALGAFKDGEMNVLVATDIAARGIDVSDMPLVINYDLPNVSETYVHRIGRTGRAKASGTALSFCDQEEKAYLRDIEKLIGQKVPIMKDNPFELDPNAPIPKKEPKGQHNKGRRDFQSKKSSHGGGGGNRGSGNRGESGGSNTPKRDGGNRPPRRRD
ncbi:MAG: DEAD/DEAH box helicase [Crocinitomicaceae bacterium]|nr:DEAD/DEAH box helicase [Crocinitomicaceae bacterium]MDG2464644.1 DEAD/DEAH box helicase [Crocinitomicaceae bacterium]